MSKINYREEVSQEIFSHLSKIEIKKLQQENQQMRELLFDVGRYARHTDKWVKHMKECHKFAKQK